MLSDKKRLSPRTIAIFTYRSSLGNWDPDKIKTGLSGSEEAVVYMAQELVKLGYQVTVYASIPPDSRYAAPGNNPHYVDLREYDARLSQFDIGIVWRALTDNTMRRLARKLYLWPHDPVLWRVQAGENLTVFDNVLWLSEAQRKQWCSWYPGFTQFPHIFGNGIVPEQFGPIEERDNPYSCIYGSSYDRGLALLLSIWPSVKKSYPRATLDICYGTKLLSAEVASAFRNAIQQLAPLDVREHGAVGHEALNRAYEKASFWTYPCTVKDTETFCISALRAQFAGAVPVIIERSALKETVQHGYKCDSNGAYLHTLLTAMQQAETISLEQRKQQREFVLQKYTWSVLASRWKERFDADWAV